MSPNPVPEVVPGFRVHFARDGKLALCGRQNPLNWSLDGMVIDCSACRKLLAHVKQMEAERAKELAALLAEREARARCAYSIWAHRAVHGVAPPFDHLAPGERLAWFEICEFFEDELLTEEEPSVVPK